ncbi:hypothetical protein [Dactylosporangium sp. CA-233914]|uniref:hypothetical protein n=1 Tax=Dactylosporangium sp. CA-233914 TaxID=3239934 RepID=UPI003D91C42D
MATTRRPDNVDAPTVAGLIERCLREGNSRDDPSSEVIERMYDHCTEQRIKEPATQRQMFVAGANGIAGTVSGDRNQVYTMFVHPGLPVAA